MASVVAAAPSDGARPLALHKLDKHFDTTHALKVVIDTGLNYGVKLFIFGEPTVPLDVGAKAEIHQLLASLPGLDDTLHVFRAGTQGRYSENDTHRGDRRLGRRAESSGNDGSDHPNHVSG
jgi:hypothetical protein